MPLTPLRTHRRRVAAAAGTAAEEAEFVAADVADPPEVVAAAAAAAVASSEAEDAAAAAVAVSPMLRSQKQLLNQPDHQNHPLVRKALSQIGLVWRAMVPCIMFWKLVPLSKEKMEKKNF